MKLWTIQPVCWYNILFEKNVIAGDIRYIEPDFIPAYNWLVQQMIERIGNKPDNVQYPIWAWYHYLNEKKKKPDLRNSHFGQKGGKSVLIEIEKNEKDVLLSDFTLWHHPLGLPYYIGDTEEDTLDFESELENLGYDTRLSETLPEKYQKKIIQSWEKIFDMNFDDPYFANLFSEKSIQATFWQLNLSEVVSVRYFTSR